MIENRSATVPVSAKEVPKLSTLGQHGYTIIEEIGRGTYAKVKLAINRNRDDAQVAIKIISKMYVPLDFLNKFLPREMEIVKMISHPHLITFYQTLETRNKCYLVMEYASQGSLIRKIKKRGKLGEYFARKYLKQILSALQYLHNLGIVHRDLKCENILFDAKNNVKIIDFGFARHSMLPKKDKLPVMSSSYCGSLSYASPEILKGESYDPFLSDIWATGVILYAMIFGNRPFRKRDINGLIEEAESKLKYPTNIFASPDVKRLIPKILAPCSYRYSISEILNDDWMRKKEEPSNLYQSTCDSDEDD